MECKRKNSRDPLTVLNAVDDTTNVAGVFAGAFTKKVTGNNAAETTADSSEYYGEITKKGKERQHASKCIPAGGRAGGGRAGTRRWARTSVVIVRAVVIGTSMVVVVVVVVV
jgi:hypothetical protein